MKLSMKNFGQKEWDLYDSNLSEALESVEKGDLQCASQCFKRIAGLLNSLSKYHSPIVQGQEIKRK